MGRPASPRGWIYGCPGAGDPLALARGSGLAGGGGRKLRYRSVDWNRACVEPTVAGYDLVRLAKLTAVPA